MPGRLRNVPSYFVIYLLISYLLYNNTPSAYNPSLYVDFSGRAGYNRFRNFRKFRKAES